MLARRRHGLLASRHVADHARGSNIKDSCADSPFRQEGSGYRQKVGRSKPCLACHAATACYIRRFHPVYRSAAQKRLDKFKKETGSTKTRALAKKRLNRFKDETGSTKTRALAKKRLNTFKAETGSTRFKAQKKKAALEQQKKKAAAKKAVAKKAPPKKAVTNAPASTSDVSPAVVTGAFIAVAAALALYAK